MNLSALPLVTKGAMTTKDADCSESRLMGSEWLWGKQGVAPLADGAAPRACTVDRRCPRVKSTDAQTDRQTNMRKKERQTNRKKQTDIDRDTSTQRNRQADRQRERYRVCIDFIDCRVLHGWHAVTSPIVVQLVMAVLLTDHTADKINNFAHLSNVL